MDSESATDCLLLKFLVLEDGLQAVASPSPTVSLMRPWIYYLIIYICTLIEFFSFAFPQEKRRNARTFLPTIVPFLKKKKQDEGIGNTLLMTYTIQPHTFCTADSAKMLVFR